MLTVLALNLALRIAAGGYGALLALRSRDWRLAAFAFAVLISGAKVVVQMVRRGPEQGWFSGIDVTHGLDLVTGMACMLAAVAARGVLRREASDRARQAARSELRSRRFAEIRNDGVWTLDAAGRTTYVNGAVAALLGRPQEELKGVPWQEILPPGTHAKAGLALGDLKLRSAVLEPVLLHHVDGSPRFVRLDLSLLEPEEDEDEGCLVHVVDITAPTLRGFVDDARQQLLDGLSRGIPAPELAELMSTEIGARLPGYSLTIHLDPGAVLAADPPVPGGWQEPLYGSDNQVLGHMEVRLPQPQRAPRSEERTHFGSIAQLTGLIIERRLTLEAFDRTRRLLEATLEESQAGILVVGAMDRCIHLANAAARRLLYPGQGAGMTLKGRPLAEHYAGLDRRRPDGRPIDREDMPLMRSLERGESCHDEQIVVDQPGQSPIWLLVNTAPLRGADGQVEAAVAVFLDVTGREQANRMREHLVQQLAAQTDELEQIFRATSHDLRSPLVNIEGFSREIEIGLAELQSLLQPVDLLPGQRAAADRLLGSELPDALGFVRSSTAKMERLLRALSVLTRLDSSDLPLRPVNTRALILRILEEMTYPIQSSGARVRVGELPDCMGMEDELAQVFSNLIDNAIKYRSPERPLEIVVSGELEGEHVTYRVRDNGIGIDSRHHGKIFETFRRLDPEGPAEGEGVGLSILSRIVARHGGNAGVDSEPDNGSTFWIRLHALGWHAKETGSDADAPDPAIGSARPLA